MIYNIADISEINNSTVMLKLIIRGSKYVHNKATHTYMFKPSQAKSILSEVSHLCVHSMFIFGAPDGVETSA